MNALFLRGTFHGGSHPPSFKTLTEDKTIRRMRQPQKVIIPLLQHTGAVCKPVVAAGDQVRAGDPIGAADAFIAAPVHASISGKVLKIAESPHPLVGTAPAVFIERTGAAKEWKDIAPEPPGDIESLTWETLRSTIKDAGIVGLGGAAFPTHVKLSPPLNKPIDMVLLNGAECEPYLTCDYRLMMEYPQNVIKGLLLIAKAVGAPSIVIALEDNKPNAAIVMKRVLRESYGDRRNIRVVVLSAKYPQGAERQLIKSVTGRTVPSGKLPLEVGCVVQNIGTAFAVYEAVYLGKPLIERCVTVTGACLKEPKNLWIRIGTPLRDVVDECGGFLEEPKKVVFGGPMMGIAQYTMDVPVIKGTSGIIFFSERDLREEPAGTCIRCAKCIDSCPMGLMPTTLMNLAKRERFQEAADCGVAACIECGACAYECPAKIPLVDYMKWGKSKIPPPKTERNKGEREKAKN